MQRSHFLSLAFSRVTLEGLRKKRGCSLSSVYHDGPCVVCFQVPATFLRCSCQRRSSEQTLWPAKNTKVVSSQHRKLKKVFLFFIFFFGWLVISPSICTTYTLYGTSIWQYKKPCKRKGMSTKTIYVQIDPFRFTFDIRTLFFPYSNSGEGHFYTK